MLHGEINVHMLPEDTTNCFSYIKLFNSVMHLGNNKKGANWPPQFGKRGPSGQSKDQRPEREHRRGEGLLGRSGKKIREKGAILGHTGICNEVEQSKYHFIGTDRLANGASKNASLLHIVLENIQKQSLDILKCRR